MIDYLYNAVSQCTLGFDISFALRSYTLFFLLSIPIPNLCIFQHCILHVSGTNVFIS